MQEISFNPWFSRGDERFRPGNLLISARNLNAVFLIDKQSKEAVWTFDAELDRQHEALMIGAGIPGHGNILVFDNGSKNVYRYRQSAVIEINPTDNSVVWEYLSNAFISQTGGVEQALPNGNVLIGSSLGGRAFEVTRSGRIVWEWTPPFLTKRPSRYAYDYCPQLVALGQPREEAVQPPAQYRYVDRPAYQFARRGDCRKVEVAGVTRVVLEKHDSCADLFLPAGAKALVAYGLDRRRVAGSGRGSYAARVEVALRPEASGEEIQLLSDTLDLSSEPWRRRTIGLGEFALKRVQLCLRAEEVGGGDRQASEVFVLWRNPVIIPRGSARLRKEKTGDLSLELTDEELEVRKEHLKSLGYVD